MKNFTLITVFLLGLANISCFEKNITSEKPLENSSSTMKKSIIFDLDGVLCTTNTLKAFQAIGITTTLEYIATQWKLPSQKELFDVLAGAPSVRHDDAYNQGIRMPNIMVDWQCATQSLPNIQRAMIDQINSSDKTSIEKELLINTIMMMTTPEIFVSTRQTIPAGVELLRELKSLGYKLYVLSNWDPTSFPLFMQKFPEIFMYHEQQMFDGIMISGDVSLLKPDAAIFEQSLHTFNLQASNIVFIDDTIENVQSAQQLGISSIHCDKNNIQATRNKLIEMLQNS